MMGRYFGILTIILLLVSCGKEQGGARMGFERHDARRTGITFANQLTETEELNVLSYEYFYNGGGVAAGDFNGDGLADLYFSGSMVPNALYLNKGNLKFEDITESAGVAGRPGGWNTGISLVDINADGRLDIYLCYSGDVEPDRRRNELYINNGPDAGGEISFSEKASDYGLADPAYTTQALFFDYDGDGDLDCYLLNHNIEEFQNFDAAFVKNMKNEFAGDKLLRNDGGKFVDVTVAAGIKNNPLGFGLGVAASDLNGDGRPDLYISNDYTEEDYLYINNGPAADGSGVTFTEDLRNRLGHIPNFSMGSDVADFNNDGLTDILALDMLPEDNRRQKLLYGPDEYEKFQSMLRNGFYHQVMRNMLQLNNGDGTFSEIGQLAGISNTDWSWSALFADFDNDGWKDLFISNGYLRDYTNRDFMAYYANQRIREVRGEPSAALMEIIGTMESTKTHNYIFRNRGDLTFENMVDSWGFADPLLTNGAAYADLDNDGDLDLVANNVNEPVAVYENRGAGGHYLRVRLQGDAPNTGGIGARVELVSGDRIQVQEFVPVRGFQSSMHLPLLFGLGDATAVDHLRVIWPDGRVEERQSVAAGQELEFRHSEAGPPAGGPTASAAIFEPADALISFVHKENPTIDFKRQSLLPWMQSRLGPALARGDVDGDERVDLFIGGAKLQPATLFLQQLDGSFREAPQDAFRRDIIHEDTDALFFDADGDDDLDLYVVSGGYDFLPQDLALQDRLYRNDGRGNFTRDAQALPRMPISGACVVPEDVDGDGDLDLFVGGRLIPGEYPRTPESHLLLNDGQGQFSIATDEWAPALKNAGMVSAAAWSDVDGDGRKDLILAGEWMPLLVFRNSGTTLEPWKAPWGENTAGWWQSLKAEDLDGDGDTDIVAGNLGTNHQMHVSDQEPAVLYYGDFDDNGSVDPILTYFIQGKSYPGISRDDLFGQLVHTRKKFSDYASFAQATIEDILTPEQLAAATQLRATMGTTVWIENQGQGRWNLHPLPVLAQASPVFAIATLDADNDGRRDLLLGGNLSATRANWGRWDANYGQLYLNRGQGHFEYVPQYRSGLSVNGDVRRIVTLEKKRGGTDVLFIRNDGPAKGYRLREEIQ